MMEITDLHNKYFQNLDDENIEPCYRVPAEPKKAELRYINNNIYSLYIDDEFKSTVIFTEIQIEELTAFYISDTEVIIIVESSIRYNILYTIFFRFKDEKLEEISKISFISPEYIILNHCHEGFKFRNDILLIQKEKPTLQFEDYWAHGIFLHRAKKVFVPEGLLKDEIERIFEVEIDVHYRPRRFKIDRSDKTEKTDMLDKLITVKLTDSNLEVKLSKLYKLDSELIDNLLENNDQEIYLPISKLDYSLECLDYLGSKYINWVILKTFIKGFELLKIY